MPHRCEIEEAASTTSRNVSGLRIVGSRTSQAPSVFDHDAAPRLIIDSMCAPRTRSARRYCCFHLRDSGSASSRCVAATMFSSTQPSRRSCPTSANRTSRTRRLTSFACTTSTGARAVICLGESARRSVSRATSSTFRSRSFGSWSAVSFKCRAPSLASEFWSWGAAIGSSVAEVGDVDVEELQNRQQLLGRERALAMFDLAQTSLRKAELLRQLCQRLASASTR